MNSRLRHGFDWVHDITESLCEAKSCGVFSTRRFCPRHQEIFRLYGAPVKGPSKDELMVAQRFVQKQLGPIHRSSIVFRNTISEAVIIALRLPRATLAQQTATEWPGEPTTTR